MVWRWFELLLLIFHLMAGWGLALEGTSDFLLGSTNFIPTALNQVGVHPKCLQDSKDYVAALLNRTRWALNMYGSTGRLPSTLVYGNKDSETSYHSPGLFDECISARADSPNFRGQYCTVFFDVETTRPNDFDPDEDEPPSEFVGRKLKAPKTKATDQPVNSHDMLPSVGFCLPSSCSATDLRTAVAQQVGSRTIGPGRNLSLITVADDKYCFTREKIHTINFDWSDYFMILLLGSLIVLVLTASLHEAYKGPLKTSHDNKKIRALRCFSVQSNWRSLFSTESASDTLSCLHGIRVLTTAWIVFSHTGQQTFHRMNYNKDEINEFARRPEMQFMANDYVSVDTFFLMSGLLVTYSLLRDLDRQNGRLGLIRFYLHRYFRLTPIYAVVLGFIATLLVHTGTGPNWDFVRRMREGCRRDWWTNLLFINNYLPGDQRYILNPYQCMTETWYLACDMQMFLIAPLLIYPLWKAKWTGLVWNLGVLRATLGATAAVYVARNLPPSIMTTRTKEFEAKFDEYMIHYYVQTYARIPPYLLGILIGYFLHKTAKTPIKLSKMAVVLGWALSAATAVGVLYGLAPYLDEEAVPVIDPSYRVAYGTLHRLAWAAAIGWVIVACAHGYGGIAQSILSWKVFFPLARMTYIVHLINYNFVKVYYSRTRLPIYSHLTDHLMRFMAILAYVFIISAVLTLLVEIPCLNLDKLFFSSSPTKLSIPSPSQIEADDNDNLSKARHQQPSGKGNEIDVIHPDKLKIS